MALDTAKIKGIAFDAYGTLFNIASIDFLLEQLFDDRARQVAATGRRQLDQVTAWRSEDAARRCGARSVVLTPWQFGGIPGPQVLRNLVQGPNHG